MQASANPRPHPFRATIPRWVFAVLVCLALFGLALPASAHFNLNLNVRVFHIEHVADGLRIYLRTPMPYLVADKIGPMGADGLPEPAPFTSNRMEEDRLVHYVEPDQLAADPLGLGEIAEGGLNLSAFGERLDGIVERVRVHRVGVQPPYATLEEAKTAFGPDAVYSNGSEATYVGDAVVDILVHYPAERHPSQYQLSSTLDPGLPGQADTANLIVDYGAGGTKIFRARGLLAEPIDVSRSTIAAVTTFIKEGFRHILEGLDHVLFVLCLTLGALGLKSLIWRATGFTLGHSVTLTLGFFGFVPNGDWFVPSVETGIALSIIYAAIVAIRTSSPGGASERTLFVITCGIGLLHGLGFSFVLHNILQVNSPDLWQSLLAFNVGVEIGQVFIILATWPVFRLIRAHNERAWVIVKTLLASACILIASIWTGQRLIDVVGTLGR